MQAVESPESLCHTCGFRQGLGTSAVVLRVHRRVVPYKEVGRCAHKQCMSSQIAHREAIIDLLDGPVDCAPVICAICNVDVLAAVAQAMCVWHPLNDARLLCQWHNSKPGHKVTCSALVLQR